MADEGFSNMGYILQHRLEAKVFSEGDYILYLLSTETGFFGFFFSECNDKKQEF